MTATTDPISSACTFARSPLSAKKSMKTKMTPEMKKSTTHSGVGITPTAPWIRSLRAASRSDVCVEPLAVRGLLGGRLRLVRLERAEQRDAPRVDLVAQRAVLHPRPRLVDDVARVADELARQLVADPGRQELGRLDLLRERERLGLRARPRRVVARECEEDDEPEQDGESRSRARRTRPRRGRRRRSSRRPAPCRRTSSIAPTATAVTHAMTTKAMTMFTRGTLTAPRARAHRPRSG